MFLENSKSAFSNSKNTKFGKDHTKLEQVKIIGDSMLHCISDQVISDHCISKHTMSCRPSEACRSSKTRHAHMAQTTSPMVDTPKFLDQAVSLIKTESHQSEIVISLPIMRTDRGGQHTKKLHELKMKM